MNEFNEFVVFPWLWWLWAGLLILWWWPKHVHAYFSPTTHIEVTELRVQSDNLSSPMPTPPADAAPSLELISAHWGVVTDTTSREIWYQAEYGAYLPLTGCHSIDDLNEARVPDKPCLTTPQQALAVPYERPLFFLDGEKYERLLPYTIVPTTPGQLIITEVMWMGSYRSSISQAGDEWLELFNTTLETLDLSGLQITQAGRNGAILVLPDGHFIPPRSFFLVGARSGPQTQLRQDPDLVLSDLTLHNEEAGLQLLAPDGTILDDLPPGPWQAGLNDTVNWRRSSAQRRSLIRPGNDWSNWTQCSATLLSVMSGQFWQSGTVIPNCGTPWQMSRY